MKARFWIPALALLVLVGMGALQVARRLIPPDFHATAYEPPETALDFALTEHTGRTLRLSDLRGRAVLLFFGYTHCPDVCPLTLNTLRSALDSIGAGADEARVVLVTVDPARDTPAVLASYVTRFGPGVSGLTGPQETLRKVYTAFGVGAQTVPGEHGHPTVMHTSGIYGIDREGRIRVLLRPDNPRAELEADLRTLIRL